MSRADSAYRVCTALILSSCVYINIDSYLSSPSFPTFFPPPFSLPAAEDSSGATARLPLSPIVARDLSNSCSPLFVLLPSSRHWYPSRPSCSFSYFSCSFCLDSRVVVLAGHALELALPALPSSAALAFLALALADVFDATPRFFAPIPPRDNFTEITLTLAAAIAVLTLEREA